MPAGVARRRVRALAAAAILWSVPALAFAQAAPGAGSRGFIGLERLERFSRVGNPAARPDIGSLVPASLARSSLRLRSELRQVPRPFGQVYELGVRDFPLPVGPGPGLVLRQVLDFGHSRVTAQFWALYQEGVRIDCWYYTPMPGFGGKGLGFAPYVVQQVEAAGGARLIFRTAGSMFLPDGVRSQQGNDFVFSRAGAALRFEYVVRRYYFHARGGDDDKMEVAVERLVRRDGEPMIELQRLTVARDALDRCGYLSPDIGHVQDRSELERVARCLLAGPEGIVGYRALGAPSYLERGG